jgi:chromosomal replication initiator protein
MTSSLRDKDVVSSLRLAIATAMGNDRFELWFGRCTISIDDNLLVVETPCDFTAHWLRQNFRVEIANACQEVLGKSLDIRFQVNAELPKKPAQRVPTGETAAQTATASKKEREGRSANSPMVPQRKFCSFDTFVAGTSNQVALTSARMVAQQPGTFSPLLIWGPPGNGKTHLLEGIWSAVRKQPRRRCIYLTSEQFTTFFLQALHGRGLPSFRRRYRDVDLLIIEDVQFFEGKRATINELLFTIDSVLRDGRQLVFSSNRSLTQLQSLGSDLTNRLGGGLVAAVQAPDEAARATILGNTAAARRLVVPERVVQLIAERIRHDVRRLVGAINRLQLYHQAKQEPVDVAMAETALADFFQFDSPSVHLRDIERAVCDQFNVKPQQLKSPGRARQMAQLRMLAMWLARRHTKAALSEIGDYFGRSHSTVISAEKRVNEWVDGKSVVRISDQDCHVNDAIRQLESRIRVG